MTIKIEGMSCKHCVKRVENALKENGAKKIKVEIGYAEFENLEKQTAISIIENLGFNCFTNN